MCTHQQTVKNGTVSNTEISKLTLRTFLSARKYITLHRSEWSFENPSATMLKFVLEAKQQSQLT